MFGKLGCIQFDPLNIVGTNPELVLQSRVLHFSPSLLEKLLYQDRLLVDDWDKMMAIYPITDRPHFTYRQREEAGHSRRRNTEQVKSIIPEVLEEVKRRGPLSSIDLDHDMKVDWSWGPTRLAKVALEDLYYHGELIIHHKVHTRKVYDLASRHIPEEILNAPDPHDTHQDYMDWHVHRRLRSLGLGWNKGTAWSGIYGAGTRERLVTLERLLKQEKVVEVKIEGNSNRFFLSASDMPELDEIACCDEVPGEASIIAPLDNLMWDRDLVRALFDFSYRWEVYKPVKDREYGYYILPVLYGDRFIARFEPGRDKKTGAMIISNWWWESGIEITEDIQAALKECFVHFLEYLGGVKLKINKRLVQREKLDFLK